MGWWELSSGLGEAGTVPRVLQQLWICSQRVVLFCLPTFCKLILNSINIETSAKRGAGDASLKRSETTWVCRASHFLLTGRVQFFFLSVLSSPPVCDKRMKASIVVPDPTAVLFLWNYLLVLVCRSPFAVLRFKLPQIKPPSDLQFLSVTFSAHFRSAEPCLFCPAEVFPVRAETPELS